MRQTLLAILIMIACFGCNIPKDGEYIAIRIAYSDNELLPPDECRSQRVDGQTISEILKQSYQGKRFQLKFKKDFIIVRDIKQGKDVVLALDANTNAKSYSTDLIRGNAGEKLLIQLRSNSNGKMALIITLKYPKGVRYVPTQMSGYTINPTNGIDCGRIVCYLSKVD
ncbi:hypothetical protein [Pedobacter namyangjuensis]|uniref:hypothetical protein n=1 Tax=Pedobacter namyangjuensis TaxID=600626 RepID=UPI0013B457B9|nr:hypothetical protein [Pedobacter namyangjuensis]